MSDMTPREIVHELDRHIIGQNKAKRAVAIALRKPEVRDRLIQLGNTIPDGMTPEATRAFIAAELDKWVPIVRATGARVD